MAEEKENQKSTNRKPSAKPVEDTEPKEVEKKETTEPKETPKKPETKKEEPKKQPIKPLIHVSDFIEQIAQTGELSNIQKAGFKAYMHNKQYQPTYDDFIPYLEKYTGKEIK